MVEWTKGEFESAANEISSILRSNGISTLWSYESGCLAATSIRPLRPHRNVQDYVGTVSLDLDETCDDLGERLQSTFIPLSRDSDMIITKQFNCIEWRFSIIYCHIWRVPVLYFTVQEIDGTPCTRQDVLQMLNSYRVDTENMTDTWGFVSSDEHPLTGTPSFFLHPCQTKQHLQTMSASTICPCLLLWSWMSLILPTVGFSISPADYIAVQTQIESRTKLQRDLLLDEIKCLSKCSKSGE